MRGLTDDSVSLSVKWRQESLQLRRSWVGRPVEGVLPLALLHLG